MFGNKDTRKALNELAEKLGYSISYFGMGIDPLIHQNILYPVSSDLLEIVLKQLRVLERKNAALMKYLNLEECEGGEFRKIK